MAAPKLGRLERVELRTQWTREATGSMPWLAKPENIEILSDTLEIELEIGAKEQAVERRARPLSRLVSAGAPLPTVHEAHN